MNFNDKFMCEKIPVNIIFLEILIEINLKLKLNKKCDKVSIRKWI